jgi:hypothetical protein
LRQFGGLARRERERNRSAAGVGEDVPFGPIAAAGAAERLRLSAPFGCQARLAGAGGVLVRPDDRAIEACQRR